MSTSRLIEYCENLTLDNLYKVLTNDAQQELDKIDSLHDEGLELFDPEQAMGVALDMALEHIEIELDTEDQTLAESKRELLEVQAQAYVKAVAEQLHEYASCFESEYANENCLK